jgi:predicted  nucleic acid-binding Zn-ribbon protein
MKNRKSQFSIRYSNNSKSVVKDFFISLRKNLNNMFHGKSLTIKSLTASIEDMDKKYKDEISALRKSLAEQVIAGNKAATKVSWLQRSIKNLASLKTDMNGRSGEFVTRYSEITNIIDNLVNIYAVDGNTEVIDTELKEIISKLTYRLESLVSTLDSTKDANNYLAKQLESARGENVGVRNTMGAFKAEFKAKVAA